MLNILPDEVFDLILYHLNQKCKSALVLINKELYHRTIKSLYQEIYFSASCNVLLVNTYVCNPFNSRYTIINSCEKFRELFNQRRELLRFVKLIMFEGCFDLGVFREINNKSQYYWIHVGLVQSGFETDISDIDITKEIAYPSDSVLFLPDSNNYTVTKLTIPLQSEVDSYDFKFISYLKTLKRVFIYDIGGTERERERKGGSLSVLSSKFEKLLNIEFLSLGITDFDDLELGSLIDIIGLNNVTSLELGIWLPLKTATTTPTFALQWLFENLPNLKHLCVNSTRRDWISIILGLIKDNSLYTLVVGRYSDPESESSIMKEILNKQEQSIQKLSCHFYSDSLVTIDGFDRIYKSRSIDRAYSKTYETAIAEVLGTNTDKYSCLNYIIMGYLHYEVTRSETGFHINPIN